MLAVASRCQIASPQTGSSVMKISLVIPTKNRLGTLRHCIQTCLESNYQDCEIIVSNNNSEDGTGQYLSNLNDERLKIVNTNAPLSMRANFEFALDQTTGDYVVFIGDDDGITRFGLETLSYLLRNTGADAVSWTPIPFVWPETAYAGALSSLVLKSRNFSQKYQTVNHEKIFEKFLNGTIESYLEGAKIYHGSVSRKVVNRVKSKANGLYFGAMAPDVFVSIANLKFLEKFIKTGCAVTISGKSSNSNGWANIKASGNRDRADLFFKDEETSEIPDPHSAVDLKIRSLRAFELDAMILVNESLYGNKLQIDYPKWLDLIAKNINCNDLNEYQENMVRINKLANILGISHPVIAPFQAPKTPTENSVETLKNRIKNTRCYSRKIKNVADAARIIDFPASNIIGCNQFMTMLHWWKFQHDFKNIIKA